jgi:hypothetical protein
MSEELENSQIQTLRDSLPYSVSVVNIHEVEFFGLLSGMCEYEAQAFAYLFPYVVNLVVVEHDADLCAALASDVSRTTMCLRPVCIVNSNVQACLQRTLRYQNKHDWLKFGAWNLVSLVERGQMLGPVMR